MANERRLPDRELLRAAGEHLGALAEQAKELMELAPFKLGHHKRYDRYAKLARVSREVLEIANG